MGARQWFPTQRTRMERMGRYDFKGLARGSSKSMDFKKLNQVDRGIISLLHGRYCIAIPPVRFG